MSVVLILSILVGYFFILIAISYFTSRGATTDTFFTADKSSPWFLVAYGMIGASLSGVTFVSVPGAVRDQSFYYFQMVLGYIPGYLFICFVLMPMYYKLNLVSIYTYFLDRFGQKSYLTASFFFLLSRTIGAAFRLFITATVLQIALFDALYIPFQITIVITLALIWVYTFRGGIKTIVWTDTFQTTFLVGAVAFSFVYIQHRLDWNLTTTISQIYSSTLSNMFNFEIASTQNFWRQLISGAFIAIVMTGMDQDLMQKNLTCKNIYQAQTNMLVFTLVLVFINLLFLSVGALLYIYSDLQQVNLPEKTDFVFPYLALQHFGGAVGVFFLLGITASSYASADSALASLTTAFCIDFLRFDLIKDEHKKAKLKSIVHLAFTILICLVILIFRWVNDTTVIQAIFKVAGYTYGPLLGMFFFALFTNRKPIDGFVPYIAVFSPLLWYILQRYLQDTFHVMIGFELLIYNGATVFFLLWLTSISFKEHHF